MTTRATVDENGVVSIYVDGRLSMLMHRREWDDYCKFLDLPPLEPEPVVSGGAIVYGVKRGQC